MGVGMWIKAEMVYTISLFEISTGSEEPTVGILSRFSIYFNRTISPLMMD